ncbi:MAG: SDR family oxidoreductase [Sphingomonadales bacterium]|nr:SDR family oxidoreductase [Sphingomonadales bacterium]
MPSDQPIALVTGASGPIGGAVSRHLLRAGADVAGVHCDHRAGHDAAAAAAAVLGRRYRPLHADLADPTGPATAHRAARAALGPAQVLVCAAGRGLRQSVLLTRTPAVAETFALNVIGVIELARLVARDMMRMKYGRIVLIGSVAGSRGFPGQAAYAASKGALAMWAASAAGELAPHGITVNVVAPGVIDTSNSVYSADEARQVAARIGARRAGTPDEVAAAVAFLASRDAAYINGAVIPVDGAIGW